MKRSSSLLTSIPTKHDIEKAHLRIEPFVHKTPLFTSESINRIAGCNISFKCENLQKIGAFKIRGAMNKALQLSEKERANGLATHSSGNHAQAIALAAKTLNIPAYIVMPENSPEVKVNAVKGYGANIIFCENTLDSRETTLEHVVAETGAYFIHPYDDYDIICGQATCAKEVFEEKSDVDSIIAPVGGGGLLSGTALSTKYFSNAKLYAGEPEMADDAFHSLKEGKIMPSVNPNTIADGLKTSLGQRNFEILSIENPEIILVSENEIKSVMKMIWERLKLVIEPSAAVPFAALLNEKSRFKGQNVAVIFSGGNVDLESFSFGQPS